MRKGIVALVAIGLGLGAPHVVKAQEQAPVKFARAWGLADSATMAKRLVPVLFRGISLTPADSAKAERAILRCFVQTSLIGEIRSESDRQKVVGLMDKRDSILVALVKAPALRDTMRARLTERRPPSFRKK